MNFDQINVAAMQPGALFQANDQLHRDMQATRSHEIKLAIRIGKEIGLAMGTLQSQMSQLDSEHRMLKDQIVQLKILHKIELDSSLEGVTRKIKTAADKVKALSERLDLHGAKKDSIVSEDARVFSALYAQILQINCEELKKYPEYCEERKNRVNSVEEMQVSPLSSALAFVQSNAIIKDEIEESMQDCEALKREVEGMRVANRLLIEKKEMMNNFHQQYLQTCSKKSDVLLNKVIELIKSSNASVQWNKLVLVAPGLYDQSDLDESDRIFCKGVYQKDKIDGKIMKIQENVKHIISELESQEIGKTK